ncbi:MAG: hypothetical protein WBF90_05765 [Rivularia sp. (in: cyanobacteria)]
MYPILRVSRRSPEIFRSPRLLNQLHINLVTVNRVLTRSTVLDDILLELHGNQQRYEGKTDQIMEKLD